MVKYDLLVYLGLVPVVAVIMFSKTSNAADMLAMSSGPNE